MTLNETQKALPEDKSESLFSIFVGNDVSRPLGTWQRYGMWNCGIANRISKLPNA